MFLLLTEVSTEKKIALNFSHVEYFREVPLEACTLVVFRGLDAETDDGMNRYRVQESVDEILAMLAGGHNAPR
jgi:hypothetical protein